MATSSNSELPGAATAASSSPSASEPTADSTVVSGPESNPLGASNQNHISLTVLSPSQEVPQGGIKFASIHLNTNVLQLKSRIQTAIAAAPPPDQQKLIYRGRPLLNNELTLRDIFRSQHTPSEASQTYILHLVIQPMQPIQPDGASTHQEPTSVFQIPGNQGSSAVPPLTQGVPGHDQLHAQIHQQTIAQAQARVHAARMLFNNQFNRLQQQHTGNNAPLPQDQPGTQIQSHVRVTYHTSNGRQTTSVEPGGAFQFMLQPQDIRIPPSMHTAQGAQGANNWSAAPQLPTTWPPSQPPPTAGSAQNHASSVPTVTRTYESTVPNSHGFHAVPNGTTNVQITRPTNPYPPDGSAPPHLNSSGMYGLRNTGNREAGSSNSHAQTGSMPPMPAQSSDSPMQFPLPSSNQGTAANNTTAWLLSSPNGPQALVFAPGFGFYTSGRQNWARSAPLLRSARRSGGLLMTPEITSQTRPQDPPDQNTNPTTVAAIGDDTNAARGQLAIRGPDQRQAQDQAQARNQPENNIFALIFQRAWLFLRLYIFIFALFDPGAWRRWILLALVVFVCLMPRENPFDSLLGELRRHVDNLIGPAVPPAEQQIQNGGARPRSDQAQQTAEERAASRLGEFRQQNPNILRDTFFRAERTLALFVASLVPGIGERHVQAREEVRREEARREEARRAEETRRAAWREAMREQVMRQESRREEASTEAAAARESLTASIREGNNGSGTDNESDATERTDGRSITPPSTTTVGSASVGS